MSTSRTLSIHRESFQVDGAFTIARGSRTEAKVLTVHVVDRPSGLLGRGECVPYAHYAETRDSVEQQITSIGPHIESGAGRQQLLELLPAGAARNAVDAALWDLEFKLSVGNRTSQAAPWPEAVTPVRTARTLSLARPSAMALQARTVAPHFGTLKLKLGGEPGQLDLERVAAVREAAPACDLIVDANESWPAQQAEERIAELVVYQVSLIEQPVAAGEDQVLATFDHQISLCADESFHTASDLERVAARYQVVNLKLDKTGGLTHALEAKRQAVAMGLGVMVGCMLGSSLAMAPALLLAQDADVVDLDGPYLLAEDREHPLSLTRDGWIGPNRECWG